MKTMTTAGPRSVVGTTTMIGETVVTIAGMTDVTMTAVDTKLNSLT